MADEPEDISQDDEEPGPPERSSATIGLITTILLCGVAIAFFILYVRRSEDQPSQAIDIAEVPSQDSTPAVSAGPAGGGTFGLAPRARQGGNLMPIKGMEHAPAAGDVKARAQQSLSEVVRPNEKVFVDLVLKYQSKYPVFLQWGKEWMSYPDLNKACKDYYKYHDPVRYAFQVAGSKNLANMMTKYSGYPELHAFLKDAITIAPKNLVKAVVDYLQKDSNAVALVKRFSTAAGLPPALTAAFTGGQVDQQAVMKQIMEQNPSLQGTLQNQAPPPPVR